MILRLKNKTLLAIDKIIVKAKEAGAIFDYLEMDINEAKLFLDEVHQLVWNRDFNGKISYHSNGSNYELYEVFRRTYKTEILENWKNEYCVFNYNNIPLKIISKKKPNYDDLEGPGDIIEMEEVDNV